MDLFPRTKEEYSCFFITPIGQPGSDERNNSDFVLNVLLRPALGQCGFPEENIVRSDHENSPDISDEMMRHLKDDDLCIADLTDLSPNVMYELGYRKGLEKPIIVIAKAGQQLPFDVHTFRVVNYDLYSDAAMRKLPATQNELKGQIMYWVDKGFVSSSGSGSVSDINNRLDSIEKKLNSVLLMQQTTPSHGNDDGSPDANRIIRKLGSLVGAFNYALRNRDLALAEALLPRLEATRSKEDYIDKAVAQVAAMGSEKAAMILKEEWEYITQNLSLQQRYEEFASYVSYCNQRDIEPLESDFVMTEARKLLAIEGISDKIKAGVYNQINRFCFGFYQTQKSKGETPDSKYLDDAIQALETATQLNSEEESYFYNLAICYREKGNLSGAVSSIQKCLSIDDSDSDHLSLAFKLYQRSGMLDEARDVLAKLRSINPYRADMLEGS